MPCGEALPEFGIVLVLVLRWHRPKIDQTSYRIIELSSSWARTCPACYPNRAHDMIMIMRTFAILRSCQPLRRFSPIGYDHLDPHGHSGTSNISTKPDELDIVQAILGKLRYFQNPSEHRLRAKLTAIANLAIMIRSALRRDSCRVHLDYGPSTDDRQRWDFVHYQPANSPDAVNSPSETFTAKLPSK
jgi:hypothetical protein